MPKSRNKGGIKHAVVPPPLSLLDSLRAQMTPTNDSMNDSDTELDNSKVSSSGWQCDIQDWSKKSSVDEFPVTLRALERKNEQSKNRIFPENESQQSQQTNRMQKSESNNNIDLIKLSSIVSDLITGKHDQSAYSDFLAILQDYSVRSSRDDHLEETVYHLVQSGVSFIRSNEYRFDPLKLQECYYQRHLRRMKSTH